MPTIEKVSALRNYQAVLEQVRPGNPVFLTKNGTGRYAIVDTDEYDFLYRATFERLFSELDAARKEADTEGWISLSEARVRLGINADA
jgi:hypothetical protein